MYKDKPCRINTYGNSFTLCHQVSDGETWQEYLAGHLGEPIRNFGMGGFGVYQAYRRMVREEQTENQAGVRDALHLGRRSHPQPAPLPLHADRLRGTGPRTTKKARAACSTATSGPTWR